MTDKITIERETLERLVRWIGGSRAIIETDLFNDLRAALAAQAQPAEPVAWMPIESSPKDGAWMYVWRKHGTFPIQAKYNIKYAWFEDDDANHLYNLTHWMPLPAAPGAAPPAPVPQKLWLWRNFVDGKPEYWAFDNPFPVHIDGDDPQTLGEPCGYAIFKPSRQGRTDVSEAEVLRRIAAAGDKT